MSFACSIIIPVFNRVDLTTQCLRTLIAQTRGIAYEVVIVDNGSSDGTQRLCAGLGGSATVVRNEENRGFAVACNQGAALAKGRHLLFLNNDTEPHSGWLPPLLAGLDRAHDVGAVGSKLLFPDGTVQHGGVAVVERDTDPRLSAIHLPYGVPEDDPLANRRRDVSVATAACLMVRREAFDQAGGFDEGYWNGYEDVDLCLTMRAEGWRIVYEPASVLTHHESASGPERFLATDDNVERLQQRWVGRTTPDISIIDGSDWELHPDGLLAPGLGDLELSLR